MHKSEARERYTFCGNGWGKTTWLINEAIAAATGYNPWKEVYTRVPAKIVFLIDNPIKITDKIIPEWRKWSELKPEWLRQDGKPYPSRIILPNGSIVRFLTWEMNPMVAESIELDYLFCDEPPPRHLFIALTRGMRELGSNKLTAVAGTPLAAPWLRTEVYDPWKRGELDYVECFKFDADQNKANLDWKEQERWFSRLTDKERQIRRHGEFFDLEGLALSHLFKRTTHVITPFKWPRNWPVVISIDPARNKPHVACALGVGPKGALYYLDEISMQAAPQEFARALKEWYSPYPVADIICDSLGSEPQTGGVGEKSFIQVLNDAGVRCRATRFADKSDERWMDLIQRVLEVPEQGSDRRPQLQIFSGNEGIVSDVENVQWTKVKNMDLYKPKLDITKKDFLAALKYALAVRPASGGDRARIHKPSGPIGIRARYNNG